MIRIPKQAVLYSAQDLPLTKADYDVWGQGFRNPFRLDIDVKTGDIYIGDVGDITIEVLRSCTVKEVSDAVCCMLLLCLPYDNVQTRIWK